jgi:hypothetical protein
MKRCLMELDKFLVFNNLNYSYYLFSFFILLNHYCIGFVKVIGNQINLQIRHYFISYRKLLKKYYFLLK